MSTLATWIQHCTRESSQSNQSMKIKVMHIGKEEIKLMLCGRHDVVYKKPLKTYSTEYKFNIKKSVIFVYSSNEHYENEIKK